MKILEEIKNIFGFKKEVKPVKKSSSNNTLATMTESERIMHFYEESQKTNKSVLDITLDMEEKRQANYIAHFEFSPKKQNFVNCRSFFQYVEKRNFIDTRIWKKIRDFHEKKAGGVCIKCGGSGLDMGYSHATEAHEVWEYKEIYLTKPKAFITGNSSYNLKPNTKHSVQVLKEIQSLCPMCHAIKHINRAFKDESKTQLLKDAYKVFNDVDDEQVEKDLQFATQKQKMIDKTYLLDISPLLGFGYDKELIKMLEDECNIESWFNPHSQEFQSFLEREFISKDKEDNS